MKSQRRHELEQNELALWLGEVIQKIKPYQNLLLGLLVAVLLGMVAYALWNRQTGSRSAAAWAALFEAMESNDVFQYDHIIEQYPGTTAAEVAAALAGDYHLTAGCRLLFENKATANQELRSASEYYLQVLESSDESSLRERATFGLARALEAQARDLDEALARYREVVENWPDGAFAVAAQRRIEDLQRPETKAMYDRFAKFDPAPAFSDEPGVPGQRPPFDLDSLPEGSPLFTPSSPFGSPPEAAPERGTALPLEIPGPPAEPAGPGEPAGAPAEPTGRGEAGGAPAESATAGQPAGESTPASTIQQPAAGGEPTGGQSPAAGAGTVEEARPAPPEGATESAPEAAPTPAPSPAEAAGANESPDTPAPESIPADGS